MLPKWANSWLTEADLSHIETAVAEAEKSTEAEIVPMLVRSSSTTGHAPWLLAAWLLSLCLAIYIPFSDKLHGDHDGLWAACAMVLIWLSSFFLAKFPFWQRFAVSIPDRDIQVTRRAQLEFFEKRLHHTKGRTGVLLMVSLMEHRAVVYADQAIADKVPPEAWGTVVEILVSGARSKQLGAAYAQAIEAVTGIVKPHFPVEGQNPNELHNGLVVKA